MKFLVCGDSHSKVLKYASTKQNTYKFEVCVIPGATAYGIRNPKSISNSYEKIRHFVSGKKTNKIIICLGEIDCAWLIWVKSKQNNISVKKQIKIHIDRLISFINDVLVKEYKYKKNNIILMCPTLPAQKNIHKYNRFKGLEKPLIEKNQKIRTNKTILYNNILKMQCNLYGYKYMDITNGLINKNGVIKNEYKTGGDFHLNKKTSYKLWINKLNKIYKSK